MRASEDGFEASGRNAPDSREPREEASADEAWRGIWNVYERVSAVLDAELQRKHALSLTEFEVLRLLAAAPELRASMTQLVRGVALSAGGVTRVVGELVTAGLVVRERRGADRRLLYAHLTPAGQERFTSAWLSYEQSVRRHLAPLGEDTTTVATALRRVDVARALRRQ